LTLDYPSLLKEICEVLFAFKLTLDQVRKAGGNESEIPKSFSTLFRPKGWVERKLEAKPVVDENTVSSDTHKVDYVKNEVAFDLECAGVSPRIGAKFCDHAARGIRKRRRPWAF